MKGENKDVALTFTSTKSRMKPISQADSGWRETVVVFSLCLLATLHLSRASVGVTDAPEAAKPVVSSGRFAGMLVSRVIDGDTIEGRITWPLHPATASRDVTVRLIGIDTPETVFPGKPVQRCGPEASAYLKRLLPPGSYVWLENESTRAAYDRFGRRLAYVWRGPTLVNAKLVRYGYSHAYLKFPFKKEDLFLQLEGEAKKDKLVLWGGPEGCKLP